MGGTVPRRPRRKSGKRVIPSTCPSRMHHAFTLLLFCFGVKYAKVPTLILLNLDLL